MTREDELTLIRRIRRYHRGSFSKTDWYILRVEGYLTRGANPKLSVKALKLLGTVPGCWYCPSHGLNGCDGKPKKGKDCTCAYRQEKP